MQIFNYTNNDLIKEGKNGEPTKEISQKQIW